MKEFIEKLIERLEEGREKSFSEYTEALELYREEFWRGRMGGFTNAIEIVNELAEEHYKSIADWANEQTIDVSELLHSEYQPKGE